MAAADAPPLHVVRFLDDAGGITALERADLAAAGPGAWEIKGARSSFRIKREPALLFLVRLDDGESPSRFQLFRLTGSGARKPYPRGESWRTVTLSVTSAGDSVGLAPVGELNEGEYAFVRAGSNEAYCFGVDPAK